MLMVELLRAWNCRLQLAVQTTWRHQNYVGLQNAPDTIYTFIYTIMHLVKVIRQYIVILLFACDCFSAHSLSDGNPIATLMHGLNYATFMLTVSCLWPHLLILQHKELMSTE